FREKIDVKDHLYYYKTKLAFSTNNDATLCKLFPISLTKPSINWLNCFRSLPPNSIWLRTSPSNSIMNFYDLCTKFLTQYFYNRNQPKIASHLFSLK
ncbi:hypothetical protein CISIN_1g044306mg, partial [Citrus sinensis]